MRGRDVCLLICATLAPLAADADGTTNVFDSATNCVEKFVYVTVLASDEKGEKQEDVVMELRHSETGLVNVYSSRHVNGSELVTIVTGPDGKLIEATKTEKDSKNRHVAAYRIWVENDTAHIGELKAGRTEKVSSRDMADQVLVVDAGLLASLGTFPFDANREITILMASFAGRFVTMTVRQIGTETVSVQAGRFECYKLEVSIDIVVKKIRTLFWLTKDAPHYLVQFEGRRGLFFAPVYRTRLVSREVTPALPSAFP